MTDFDGAWKEALEQYFRPFLEFCFPDIAARVDWSKGFEFLDKELQKVVHDAEMERCALINWFRFIGWMEAKIGCLCMWKFKVRPTMTCLHGCTNIITA